MRTHIFKQLFFLLFALFFAGNAKGQFHYFEVDGGVGFVWKRLAEVRFMGHWGLGYHYQFSERSAIGIQLDVNHLSKKTVFDKSQVYGGRACPMLGISLRSFYPEEKGYFGLSAAAGLWSEKYVLSTQQAASATSTLKYPVAKFEINFGSQNNGENGRYGAFETSLLGIAYFPPAGITAYAASYSSPNRKIKPSVGFWFGLKFGLIIGLKK